jgi:hypothetical protein
MAAPELQPIADAVLRRAQQQGFILPSEIRSLLTEAKQPESLWRDVVDLARAGLSRRGGRYYPLATSERARRDQDHQQAIDRAVRGMVRVSRAAARNEERRQQARTDFVQLVTVRTENGLEFTLLSRDVSPTGIRLIGTHRLLGQKVRLSIPNPIAPPAGNQPEGWTFLVRILWTCAVGEDLFENGGTFIELIPSEQAK